MAMVKRGVGTLDRAAGAIAPGLPTGTAAGDLLVMFLETLAQAITVSGWTEAAGSPVTQGNVRLTVFYRRATGTDPTTTSDSGDHQIGQIVGFTGVRKSGSPFNVTATGTDTTSDTSGSIPGATTTDADCYVLAACGTDRDFTDADAEFASWTNADLTSGEELMDSTTAAGGGGGLGVYGGFYAGPGTYSATAVTLAHASVKPYWTGALEPESAPVVVLDSIIPVENGDTTNITPTLRFTGVDLNNDDLEYQVQVGDDAFLNASATIDSYSESNFDVGLALKTSADGGAGQKITGDGRTITSAQFYIRKQGSPTGNVVYKLYADGSFPGGTLLATSEAFDVSTLTTSYALVEVNFASPYALGVGTNGWLTCEYTNGDASNYMQVGEDATAPTHAGIGAKLAASVWGSTGGADVCFYALGPATTLLDKESVVSATGFVDVTSGDTHPYTPSDIMEYTVQSGDALIPGTTYYWRVRAADPSGTNVYGAWSSTKSFVVVPLRPRIVVAPSAAVHRAAGW